MKWPKYVRLQRQRRILRMRLKVPPALYQFTKTLERNQADNLFRLLMKYRWGSAVRGPASIALPAPSAVAACHLRIIPY